MTDNIDMRRKQLCLHRLGDCQRMMRGLPEYLDAEAAKIEELEDDIQFDIDNPPKIEITTSQARTILHALSFIRNNADVIEHCVTKTMSIDGNLSRDDLTFLRDALHKAKIRLMTIDSFRDQKQERPREKNTIMMLEDAIALINKQEEAQ